MKMIFEFWLAGASFIAIGILITFMAILLVDLMGAVILQTKERVILKTVLPAKPYKFLEKLIID